MTIKLTLEEENVILQHRKNKKKIEKQKQEEALAKLPYQQGSLKENIYYDQNAGDYINENKKNIRIRGYISQTDEDIKFFMDDFILVGKTGEKMVAHKNKYGIFWTQASPLKDTNQQIEEDQTWAKSYIIDIENINNDKLLKTQKAKKKK